MNWYIVNPACGHTIMAFEPGYRPWKGQDFWPHIVSMNGVPRAEWQTDDAPNACRCGVAFPYWQKRLDPDGREWYGHVAPKLDEIVTSVESPWASPYPAQDIFAGRAVRDEGIERSGDGVAGVWRSMAYDAVVACARQNPEFIVDSVWNYMLAGAPTVNEKRAMGSIMLRAKRAGIIQSTTRYRPTSQIKSHASPTVVWLSLVYEGAHLRVVPAETHEKREARV